MTTRIFNPQDLFPMSGDGKYRLVPYVLALESPAAYEQVRRWRDSSARLACDFLLEGDESHNSALYFAALHFAEEYKLLQLHMDAVRAYWDEEGL